jgi:membrane-associated phospholipid phosphatase
MSHGGGRPGPPERRLRTPEWILAAYLAYTSALALLLPLADWQRRRIVGANAAAGALYTLLLLAGRRWPGRWSGMARDWAPLAGMILCYEEMGWFARPHFSHGLEQSWVAWDRALLYGWGLKAGLESLGALLPALLELCYILVYAFPVFLMAMIYIHHRRERAAEFLTIYMLGLALSYGQFPFWPSDPPRTLFAGQDLPAFDTALRRFALWMLAGAGIHTGVFPSAHVSGAVAGALAAWRIFPDRRWLSRGALLYAAAVAVATVYGRYHYAADAVAGIAVGALACAAGAWLIKRRRPETAAPPPAVADSLSTRTSGPGCP